MNSKIQSVEESKRSHFRWVIVGILFFVTAINYADRTVLSIAGPELAKSLNLNTVSMDYIFSAFGWSYVLAQLPGGFFSSINVVLLKSSLSIYLTCVIVFHNFITMNYS